MYKKKLKNQQKHLIESSNAYNCLIDLPVWYGMKYQDKIRFPLQLKNFFSKSIKLMQKVYFIQGAGRSGLELLTSLFDGADEILCLPFTLKIIDIWKKKIKNNYSNFDELFYIKTQDKAKILFR